jgi:hypothetical protein
MSTRKKNLIPAYICLVGIPILGLVTILDAGHDLRAPIAVGGAWQVQGDFEPLASVSCTAPLARSQRPMLTISQSGNHLTIALDRMQGAGRMEHATMTADGLRLANDAACETGDGSRYLRANLAEQNVMTGVIGVNGCSSCAAVPFRATRQPQAHTGH